jgi:hypothetical protein
MGVLALASASATTEPGARNAAKHNVHNAYNEILMIVASSNFEHIRF